MFLIFWIDVSFYSSIQVDLAFKEFYFFLQNVKIFVFMFRRSKIAPLYTSIEVVKVSFVFWAEKKYFKS
jgi:hypothetical protein